MCVSGGGVGHGVGGYVAVGEVDGVEGGGIVGPHDTPIIQGIRCPPCYFLAIW